MKKSISLYFDDDKNINEKLLKIKQIGFDQFFIGIKNSEVTALSDQCNFAKKIKLKCTMIHCLYDEKDMHYFWEVGKKGDDICEDYCNQIKSCKDLTKNFIIHLNAKKDQKQTDIGIFRLKKILNICDDMNINLCVENLYSTSEIPYIFSNIKHKKLKICLDVGHQNCLTPDFDILNDYGKFVEVLHLHDNNGLKDEHLICGQGNIDWFDFSQKLKKFPKLVLSAEVKNRNNDENFLEKTYESLCMIENLIKK